MTCPLQAASVRALFEKLNTQDERGYSCLHWLVLTGNDRPLCNVLKLGADPTLRDAQSLTALDRACKLGRHHMVQTLVEACPALLYTRRETDGRGPLHFANESTQASDMVTLLLELGADVNARSHLGRSILHESILRGSNAEHVSYIIAYGADIHARDVNGWTPLHYAAYLGQVKMVEDLLYHGADPQARDANGRTPLHYTASKVTLPQWDQDTATAMTGGVESSQAQKETTEWSRKFGRRTPSEIVRILLAHGATTWVEDNNRDLTFSFAARVGEVDVTYEILQVAVMEGLFG